MYISFRTVFHQQLGNSLKIFLSLIILSTVMILLPLNGLCLKAVPLSLTCELFPVSWLTPSWDCTVVMELKTGGLFPGRSL